MTGRSKSLRYAVLGVFTAALLTTTPALAGSGVGGVFNLGVLNTVNARTLLVGTPATGTSMLEVRNGSSLGNSFGVLGRLTSATTPSTSAGVLGLAVSGTG